MTTIEAKNLILNQKNLFLFRDNDKWKRIKKYKNTTGLILRDFKSTANDSVIICENSSGDLNIYDFILDTKPISLNASKFLSESYLLTALNQDLLKYGYQPENTFNVDYEISNWHYINDIIKNHDHFYEDISSSSLDFNYENKSLTYCLTNNGYAYLKVHLGDDNEFPIEAYVYWSENEHRMKGFVPCGQEQYYNYEENRPYNNEDQESNDLNYEEHKHSLEEQLENVMARDYENI